MTGGNVRETARYILATRGPMTPSKLQKLVYYAQAWSLVWDGEPLYPEPVEAWANGPVVPELYGEHRGRHHIEAIGNGNIVYLTDEQRATIDAVLDAYGELAPWQLSKMSQREPPWRDAQQRRSECGRPRGREDHARLDG